MFDQYDFNKRFERNQRRFDTMFRIVSTLIGVGLIATIAFWIFLSFAAVKSVDVIQEQGLRGLVEQIWCGNKNKECLK